MGEPLPIQQVIMVAAGPHPALAEEGLPEAPDAEVAEPSASSCPPGDVLWAVLHRGDVLSAAYSDARLAAQQRGLEEGLSKP